MLFNVLMIVAGLVLLGAVGFIGLRQRRMAAVVLDDDDDRDVAPVLYVPRSRNTFDGVATSSRPAPAVVSAPTPQPHRVQGSPRYIAPLSGPVDAIVQLLPGRLVPLGNDADQEIRFVRVAGENRFTFGRSARPEHTHIQLLAPTASRMHAYMIIENGSWRIGNMSETNQVIVNGEELASGDADRWLHDGDRIELGEVTFVFRER